MPIAFVSVYLGIGHVGALTDAGCSCDSGHFGWFWCGNFGIAISTSELIVGCLKWIEWFAVDCQER